MELKTTTLQSLFRGILAGCALAIITFIGRAQPVPEIVWWKAGHSSVINSVTFSPDGQTVASGSADSTIKLWQVSNGSLLRTLSVSGVSLNTFSMRYSAGGDSLVSLNFGGLCCVWDPTNGTLQRILTNAYGGNFYAISADTTLVAGGSGNQLAVVHTSDGSVAIVLTNAAATFTGASFFPDGTKLATVDSNHTVIIWSLTDGSQLNSIPNWYASLQVSPDGQSIMGGAGSDYAYIILVNATNGQSLWMNNQTIRGNLYAETFSADGQFIASGASNDNSGDPPIRLWRISDGTLIRAMNTTEYSANSVAFSPDGTKLVSGGYIGNGTKPVVRVWNVADGSLAVTMSETFAGISALSLSPDATLLASGSIGDGTTKLWRVGDATLLRSLTNSIGSAGCSALCFSSDNLTLAGGSGNISGWRVSDGAQLWLKNIYPWMSGAVAASPVSNIMAVAEVYSSLSNSNQIELRRFSDGQVVQTITGFTNSVKAVCFSPDGTMLASGCADKAVTLWQVGVTNLIRTINVTSEVCAVSFSPDGTSLATGSSNKLVKIWRLSDGALLRTLSGHSNTVTGVIFSPDGGNLLSSSSDGTLRLWRVSNGALLATYNSEVLSPACLAGALHNRLFAYGRNDAVFALCRWPTPVLQTLGGGAGGWQFQLNALTGQVYSIQTSMDLQSWSDLKQVTPTNRITSIIDTNSGAAQFYRAKVQ